MQEDYEEFNSLTLSSRILRRPSRMLARNWKHQWLPPCLARHAREASVGRPVARLMISSLTLRESWKPVNLQGCVWENIYRIIMNTILLEKETTHYSTTICYTLFPMLQAIKIPAAKAAAGIELETLEKIPPWDNESQKQIRGDRWRKDEGRKTSYCHTDAQLSFEKCWIGGKAPKIKKVGLCSEAILWKMILDLLKCSPNKGHHHHK